MGEIASVPPAYRIPPTRPVVGGDQTPQRKPAPDDRHPDQQRRRKKDDDDDAVHVDEYA